MTVTRHIKPLWTQRLLGFPEATALFGRGEYLAVGSTDGDVVCFHVATGKLIWSVEGHAGGLTCVASLPGSTGFLTGGEDGILRAWSSVKVDHSWSCDVGPGWVNCIGVSSTGQVVVGSGARILRVGVQGEVEGDWTLDGRVGHLLFTSDETRLIAVSARSIVIFSFPDGARLREVPLGNTPQVACLSHDDIHLAVGLSDRSIRFLRLDHTRDEAAGLGPFRTRSQCVGWTPSPSHLVFSDLGRAFLASAEDLDCFLESAYPEGKDFESAIRNLPAPYGKPRALSIHPTAPIYALGSDEGQLMVGSLHHSAVLADLELEPGGVQHLHWLPDGTDLLYVLDGGQVGVLRIPCGEGDPARG